MKTPSPFLRLVSWLSSSYAAEQFSLQALEGRSHLAHQAPYAGLNALASVGVSEPNRLGYLVVLPQYHFSPFLVSATDSLKVVTIPC